jgi:2-polyprenyl-3-methyl-5-hydroxy-6-metoxy-1,4-benzoquinol methylase
MKCRVCNSESNEVFSAKVLNKYNVKYYHCPSCGFLQTEEPYWLNEAYKSAIGIADTGIQKRNQLFAKRSSAIITSLFDTNKKFLDYAGGYGIFVRMMRDKGFDFYWDDPYADNLFAKGFEHNEQNKYELITAFECFEHFTDPINQIQKMLELS